MSDNYDQLALSWVRKEINNTLEQARQGLENFAEDTQDQTQIQFCINCLHQVQGTLQMLDFSGAARLALEMESLADKMANDQNYAIDSAFEVLMRALLQMPGYLERVEEGHKDIPVILLPLLNQIREVSNLAPISEKELFSAGSINIAPPKAIEKVSDKDKTSSLQDNVKKLRAHFQKGLTSVIRGEKIKESLARIHKVLLRLEALTEGSSIAKLWWVADGFIFSITEKGLYKKKEIHQLLGKVDKTIGRLADMGAEALNDEVPEELLSQLLYYVARSTSKNTRVVSLKNEFNLESYLADSHQIKSSQEKLARPDTSAVTNVAGALNEELVSIKDQLDLFVRAQSKDLSQLQSFVDSLSRIEDTLTLLELAIPRDVIRQQTRQIQSIIDKGQVPGDSLVMDIAGALLFVEANLKNIDLDVVSDAESDDDVNTLSKAHAKEVQVDEATHALIQVARKSMQSAKDKIIGYIASGFDINVLSEVPTLLEEVIGGVKIVQFDEAAKILQTAKDFVDSRILNNSQKPSDDKLEALADVITSVEYYLEASEEGKYKGLDSILNGAVASVKTLSDALLEVPLVTLEVPLVAKDEPELDITNGIISKQTEIIESEPIESKENDLVINEIDTTQDSIVKQTTRPEATVIKAPAPKQIDESLIDDEVLEIFLEEAEEEIEAIGEMLPRWTNNPQDTEALTTLRRSFHTLKGSGRLVGAAIIGEVSWAIENVLNKVIEESIPAESPVIGVLSEMHIMLPRLVTAFSTQQDTDCDYEQLIAKAEHVAAGKPLSDFLFNQDSNQETTEAESSSLQSDEEAIDPILLDIFSSEAQSHLRALKDFLDLAPADGSVAVSDELIRALHTLKGSAKMANVEPMAGLTGPLEKYARLVKGGGHRFEQSVIKLLNEVYEYLAQTLNNLINSHPINTEREVELLNEISLLSVENANSNLASSKQRDQRFVSIFLTEGLDILHELSNLNEQLKLDLNDTNVKSAIKNELHTFYRGAEMVAIPSLVALAGSAEKLANYASSRSAITEDFTPLLAETIELLTTMLNKIASEEDLESPSTLVDKIESWIEESGQESAPEDMDVELVELFVEEGEELIETARELLARWKDNLSSKEITSELRRIYHTIKGSSRMAGAMNIGDLGHAAEDIFNTVVDFGRSVSDIDHRITSDVTDKLESMVAELKTIRWPGEATQEIRIIRQHLSPDDTNISAVEDSVVIPSLPEKESKEELTLPELNDSLNEIVVEQTEEELTTLQLDDSEDEIVLEQAEEEITISQLNDSKSEMVFEQAEEELSIPELDDSKDEMVFEQAEEDLSIPQLDDSKDEMVFEQAEEELSILQLDDSKDEMVFEQAEEDLSIPQLDDPEDETVFEQTEEDSSIPQLDDSESEIVYEQAEEELAIPQLDDSVSEIVLEQVDEELTLTEIVDSEIESETTLAQAEEELLIPELTEQVSEIEMMQEISIEPSVHTDSEFVTEEVEQLESIGLEDSDETPQVEHDVSDPLTLSDPAEATITDQKEATIFKVELDEDGEEVLDIYMEEAEELLLSLDESLQDWSENLNNKSAIDLLQRTLHTFKGGARLSGLPVLGDLTHEMETYFEKVNAGLLVPTNDDASILLHGNDVISNLVKEVQEHRQMTLPEEYMNSLNALIQGETFAAEGDLELVDVVNSSVVETEELISEDLKSEVIQDELDKVEPREKQVNPTKANDRPVEDSKASNTIAPSMPVVVTGNLHKIELDKDGEEVFEIYLEEAEELLIALDEALHDWSEDLANKDAIDLLQRTLHTFKGGARLSDLVVLGDLTHEMETYFERINAGKIVPKATDVNFLLKGYDIITSLIHEVEQSRQMTVPETYMKSLHALIRGEDISLTSFGEGTAEINKTEDDDTPIAEVLSFEKKKEEAESKQKQAKSTDIIRVPSEQLEELVNLAGETSIFRSRLEQQMSVLRYNLEEMSSTVERLREQLRNLDIETDAQISYRKEISGGVEYEDFDPLEMDRYTRQQELTRGLSESAVDLMSLKDALDSMTSDSETLLLQQGRINTEMQESLMRTRMIPFESLVPRLRRMVRQISTELGKTIELAINADGEMDRSVLERLIAPLEHMLRNAMDHGIETQEERKAVNKTGTGRINIALYREGSEVFVKIQDDGRGLNLPAIRAKAIERGLINESSELTDHELQQLVLEAGFSTAEKVTQISGRGVGMDVVSNEIKQMGGVIEIDSAQGVGSTFTVKLPFTVSVNHAMMVELGEEIFAIPLANIEGIVRVSPFELEEYYSTENAPFEYAGVDYKMHSLATLLDHNRRANLQGVTQPLPVLLLHGAEHPTALQVDGLLGSREIVVKSIGSQLSSISGLSGATILGDGRVVMILDMPALIRRIDAVVIDDDMTEVAEVIEEEARIPRIMVVDDSITVRKVTTRLLERHDFEVITAKDGVDALAVLGDQKPDVMLLDIEMPRMDGFELATIIRHDEHLKDLPIIMITSRTGDKHRERAEQIGVEKYMGKPYNEVDLIESISELLPTRV